MPLTAQQASVSYSRASLFAGLPRDLEASVERVLDNRLASSSWRTINAGLKLWRAVAAERNWGVVIPTDDPERGGKLVTFVMTMMSDTELVWGSIQGYLWGLRTWMTVQRQADPAMGVERFDTFLHAVKVLTWVPSEPRRRTPISVVSAILDDVDADSFEDVQFAFLMLTLLFTYSRSECPCPKTFTGTGCYSADVHWNVQDLVIAAAAGAMALWVRFRVIKQDQRVERPEARGDGDWSLVGDIPGSKFSIVQSFLRCQPFYGARLGATPDAPFFVESPGGRPLLYRVALEQFKARQRRVGVAEDDLTGLHGLRVAGYNGTEAALGEDLAQAHGLWKSKAHKRYHRWDLAQVSRIPAAIVDEDGSAVRPPSPPSSEGGEGVAERPAGPSRERLHRFHFRANLGTRASRVDGSARVRTPSRTPSRAQPTVEEESQDSEAEAPAEAEVEPEPLSVAEALSGLHGVEGDLGSGYDDDEEDEAEVPPRVVPFASI